jgi:uncharacterized membrane protein
MKISQQIQLKKTVSWAFISVLITIIVGWAITNNIYYGLGIGLIDRLIKMIIYYSHERVWHGKYKMAKETK